MIYRLLAILLVALPCSAQTWSTWNGKTVGGSTGNVSAMDGKTIGTATGNFNKWNNLASPTIGGGGGGPTITVVQAVSDDSGVLTVAPIAAGDLAVVCYGYAGTLGQTIAISDSAGNTYTNRTASIATNTADGFQTGCFDDMPVATGGATTVSMTSAPTGYTVMWFFEFHRSSGTWAYDTQAIMPNGTSSGTAVSGPSIAMTGAPGVAVTGFIVNNSIVTNPASGNAWTASNPISADGNAANAIITSGAGSQQSVITDSGSSDPYCASAVAYK